MFATHHDVRRDDVGVVTHGFDEEDLGTKKKKAVQRLCSVDKVMLGLLGVAIVTLTLKPFSLPNVRIISRLSLVVFVASKT